MSLGNLPQILHEEIQNAARNAVLEMIQPGQIFNNLPDVCGVEELIHIYNVSNQIILRMAQAGMPHTHAGREYRFHRSLLIEWTRAGEKPFPCQTCEASHQKTTDGENLKNIPLSPEEVIPENPVSIKEYKKSKNGDREIKLAKFAE